MTSLKERIAYVEKTHLRPWEVLSLFNIPPRFEDPSDEELGGDPLFFYKYIVKPLIPDAIRLMVNGVTINQEKVEDLRTILEDTLKSVRERIDNSKLIAEYQEYMYPIKFKEFSNEIHSKMKTYDKFLKPYKNTNMVHRTKLVNWYLNNIGLDNLRASKWTVNSIKKLIGTVSKAEHKNFLQSVVDKTISQESAREAMIQLAKEKAEIYNRVRLDKIKNVDRDKVLPPFNPGSSTQLQRFFEYIKATPISYSKTTGLPSWSRDNIIAFKLEVPESDKDLHTVLDAIIDYSFSAIVKNNFLSGFAKYTIDGTLHGNLRLLGALSARCTSNKINLLNMPSTKSRYSKPLKRCFKGRDGFLVAQYDYKSLEEIVLTNITEDAGKLSIQNKGLDAHCYNALTFDKEEVEAIIGEEGSYEDKVRRFMKGVEEGNAELKKIRQESKPKTFKLSLTT